MTVTTEVYYPGDGVTTQYTFPFPYIDETHINVSIYNPSTGVYEPKAQDDATYGWRLANANTVEFTVTAPPAPLPGDPATIHIYRRTEIDQPYAEFFPGAPLNANDLNDNFEQSLYAVQEATFGTFNAEDTSNAALATANEAKSAADGAVVTANQAQSTANAALGNSTQALIESGQAQTDAAQAQSDSAQAQSDAANALAAVDAASIYTEVSNVAAIPGSPSDDDRILVRDSTGIDSFTPLAGLPVGPIWGTGLYVRMFYQGTTWNYVDYQANDPDGRYTPFALAAGDNISELVNDVGYLTSNVSGDLTVSGGDVQAANLVSQGDVQTTSLNGGQLAGFRNVLINGDLAVNQRNLDVASVAVGEYGQDRWKKTAGGMTQVIEDGNFEPGATYTLSGTGITTQQLTAPASGNWTLPDIPVTARKIQLELGTVATPFERRSFGLELMLCMRYYQQKMRVHIGGITADGIGLYGNTQLPVTMRANPTAQQESISLIGSCTSLSLTHLEPNYVDYVVNNGPGGSGIGSAVFSLSAEL